jgi:hypothetical protein
MIARTMHSFRRQILALPVLAAFTLAFGQSGGAGGSALQELKKTYHSMLKDAGRSLYDQYQKRLEQLEKEFAAQKDYAAAAKVRGEREAAARELGLMDAASEGTATGAAAAPAGSSDKDGSIVMDPQKAETGGGVAWDQEKGALAGWQSDKAWARWKLPAGLATCGYEVELTFACATGSGGQFVVREDFYSLKRTVADSGSWESFRTEVIGTLRIRAGSQTLQISATAVQGGGLFYLKSIRLVPCNLPS